MKKVFAFINGMLEFRSSYTTHYSRFSLMCAYDAGREMAHKITLRKFEQ